LLIFVMVSPMSELQLALLAIGIGVIVVLYAFGWWQQRQYRHRFGEAFSSDRADALYQGSASKPPADMALGDIAERATGYFAPPAESSHARLDETCSLLDRRTDFIIELNMHEASLATGLEGLWQRKFDFGKPVQVCGLAKSNGKWERVIAESPALYDRFRIALQLADRSGAVSAAKLSDFRDLVSGIANHIKADSTIPDIDNAHRMAQELDAFCAKVDQMIGVNLKSPGERLLLASKISQSSTLLGMTLESDGAFHLLDAHGYSLFSLSNQNAEPFQHHLLETMGTACITLLLDIPRVENPAAQFDRLMHVANGLAKSLQVNLVDDNLMPLNESGLASIRSRIAEVEAQMIAQGIAPGSAQARRLFS